MKRPATAMFALVIMSCNVADEVVIDDQPTPQAAAEPAAPARPTALLELDEQVRSAIDALPEDNGWPNAVEFDTVAGMQIEPYRLVECGSATLRHEKKEHATGPIMLGEIDGQWAMLAHADQSQQQWTLNQSWTSPDFDPAQPLFVKDGAELECHAANVQWVAPTRSPFSTFVYTSVLTTPDEPTFVEPKLKEWNDATTAKLAPFEKLEKWSEADVQKLLDVGPPASHHIWEQALGWAKAEQRADLAYEIHRRYRPMGRCSRDSRPQHMKQEFAQVCNELSRPRCYLNLSTQLLAYRHSRVSDMWIGGKPVSYNSRLDLLPEPVDAELFMLGLLVDYPGTAHNESAAISPRFFALAQDESGYTEALDEKLVDWLTNPDTDAWNRHRFAVALFFMRTLFDKPTDQREHAKEVAELAGVPTVTVAQLQNVANHVDN